MKDKKEKMKWVSVKDSGLPKEDCFCVVANSKGWMFGETFALFYCNYGSFSYYNRTFSESLVLEVTHYIIIPPFIVGEEEVEGE